MLSRIIASTIIAGLIFSGTVEAYDLPKITADKKITAKEGDDSKKSMFASDWEATTLFESKLKDLLEKGTLSPASPKRIFFDKNCVFIAFYKGNAYFLDKYSLKVKNDSDGRQSWTQKIFPIGKGISPQNSKATDQNFYFDGKNFYNSLKKNSPINAINDADDRAFLAECFKVGYYFAFGKEL